MVAPGVFLQNLGKEFRSPSELHNIERTVTLKHSKTFTVGVQPKQYSNMEGYSSIQPVRINDSITNFETSKSNSQRKDTKDSGYGESLHEFEEDLQNLPDWCRQCLKANEGSYIDEKTNGKDATR